MDEKVEKMMKQLYKNRKELLETKQRDLRNVEKDNEEYIVEMKEKKQYISFLKETLEKQEDEVIKKELQKTIERVKGVVYYEEGQLESFENQKQKLQKFIDLVETDVIALATFLKQEGADLNEEKNG